MKKIIPVFLAFVLLTGLAAPALAASKSELDNAINSTAAYMLETLKNPQVDSVGGEWAVIGLARSGYSVPDSFFEGYYKTVERYVQEHGPILHDLKYTDNSRVILGLTAAGYDPRDIAGQDLTVALGDFERTIWQGINGPVWAIIALDSLDYPIPLNPQAQTQATRDMYIAEILRRQTPDGGWNLTAGAGGAPVKQGERGDADLTGMALQALAKYRGKPEVDAAIDKAISFLSDRQDKAGGYATSYSAGSSALESAVQALVALCELGIPADDKRFVKSGKTLVDSILSFKNSDGSFRHSVDGSGRDQMSTEQALYALVAAQRAAEGKKTLYNMTDANQMTTGSGQQTIGLPGKHDDVKQRQITAPDKTFPDIQNHINKAAIEGLAAREIIGGRDSGLFDPDSTVTRAEFAKMVTFSLGLPEKRNTIFTDVRASDWFEDAVASAYYYEITKGTTATTFKPYGTITRQEATVMVARAAALCGMDTKRGEVEIRNTLAPFGDYRSVENWAQVALAFCYDTGILDDSEFDIGPTVAIKRCEVAEMLYRLLDRANLL